ncbi:MAG: patatin-like phospholipase family protein [Thermoanaerobaculales bacterium]|nr:patatin-like phospholipase family protein [Thermoanaerobaculales bacterium]
MKRGHVCLAVGPLLIVLAAVGPAAQVEEPPAPPPRIGLVLSGGGARGNAHVGVLKVLEELRIPIDFIAGTSMGAIIGGLYSVGVSPTEMEEILAETDWRELLDDRPPRRHLPFRQKVDDQTYLVPFEAGFNGGSFQIPSGLISGQKLGFALQLMVLQAAGIDDFDRLPIPFRAVATDLENGEMVVLRGGDLGQAMRASMSLPGIFSPIEIDDRLLVDGGLARNLPVDVARDMGADVIIAVDVGQPLPDKDELASIGQVTRQVIGMQIVKNVEEQALHADVLIRPELDGFGSFQFEKSSEMVPFGEVAAQSVAADLERYSVSEEAFQAHLRKLRRRRSFSGAKVTSIQLTSSSTADPRFVLLQVTMRPGDSLDFEVIRQDLERLYETGDYERVNFRLNQVDDDFELYIEAIDKSWGPNYLRFGFNLFADFEGESSFDVLASYTMTKLNRMRGEIKLRAQLGENPAIFGEFYQPLSLNQTWFTAASLGLITATEYLPVGGGASVPYRIDRVEARLDLGLQVGRYAEFRLGLSRGSIAAELRGSVDSGDPVTFPRETESDLGGLRFTAVVDQFDNMNFPHHGYFAVADYFASREDLDADIDYEHLIFFLGGAATRGRHTLLGLSNFYSALGTDSPEIYSLGGLFNLSGAPQGSITGQYGGNLSLLYLYRLLDLPMGMGNGLYIGASIEGGNLWHEKNHVNFSDLRYAGAIFIGMDTILGPLYLAQGFSEGGDAALYFFLGRTF